MQRSRREFLKKLASGAAFLSGRPSVGVQEKADSRGARELRGRLARDPLRPQFHLLPAKNWMNDPNGPIYWKGIYHMFFQYNPNAAVWGDMHWAHAVSTDMIHWRHLPIALAPTPNGDDANGCFTGSAVDDRGTATIVYTGVKSATPERATLRDGTHNFREVQCLATSSDPELRAWTKEKKPILQPPDDPDVTGFRDPFLWQEGETWYLGVASGWRKKGGAVLLYRSGDLRRWEYLHPLTQGKWTEREAVNPVDSGEMWECPDFFPVGSKHVLLHSTAGQVIWETGELDRKEMLFHSEKRGVLDHGAYYAQKTQLDAGGNRILWGWIPERRAEAELRAAGWAGCMSLPRVVSIGADGELKMRFAEQAHLLRASHFELVRGDRTDIGRAEKLNQIVIENLCGEMRWNTVGPEFQLELADQTGPWWSLKLEAEGATMRLTVNGASIDLPGAARRERNFHLYVDASVAELICDEKHAMTSRVYRKPNGPLRIVVREQNLTSLGSLEAWQLRPISKGRLTDEST